MLRPQDVLVSCKLHALGEREWTFITLGNALGISAGETHNAVERCKSSGLIAGLKSGLAVNKPRLFELLTQAVPQIFYAEPGRLVTGIPTAQHATPLRDKFHPAPGDGLFVWAYEKEVLAECVRGETLAPLYPTVPEIVRSERDPILYELLALVDVVRIAGSKDRKKAISILGKKILGKSYKGEETPCATRIKTTTTTI